MANKGLRVIGIAKAEFETVNFKLPEEQHAFDFKFVGFIGLENPIRETVPNAIQKCYRAGIRVVMITGDYPETAVNIGKKIALMNTDDVLVGSQLKNMSDSQFRDKIKEVDIFARIVPEQKLRIVNALKASGDIVAMTGDGVNDAPALKAAHIGVAMGKYGTDVARDASELVLLDDDFSSIVESVGLGRRIFDNIKKAISYTLSVHIPIIGISLLPLFLKLPLILLPIHIVFLELIIDPACSIIFEAEPAEFDIMSRPPRDTKESIFNKETIKRGVIQGFIVLLTVLVVFYFGYFSKFTMAKIRTLTFVTLVLSNIGLIFTNRSWSKNIFSILKVKNSALWWIVSGALIFLILVLYIPVLSNLFHFASLNVTGLFLCFFAVALSIICSEIFKKIIE